jgi:hypothetical protein
MNKWRFWAADQLILAELLVIPVTVIPVGAEGEHAGAAETVAVPIA